MGTEAVMGFGVLTGVMLSRRGDGRTFFMMPALRLEKVMCLRDLSLMNLISIFRRSRLPFSSSSSSSSAADGRWRFTPRDSWTALPLPTAWPSSSSVGEVWSCWSAMSAIAKWESELRTSCITATKGCKKGGGDTALSVVPMDLYWIWSGSGEKRELRCAAFFCRRNLVGRALAVSSLV